MKNIGFFSDGTWNDPDRAKTNVYRLYAAARAYGIAAGQVVGYDAGVGTGRARALGGATGWGISQNVRDAYRFIAEHYEPEDRIYLFGFSRGAYTARSVAGFIRKCGVLQRRFLDKLDEAFTLYRTQDHPTQELATAFRFTYGHGDTPIHFVGVWDTVGALGIPGTVGAAVTARLRAFHDVELSSQVRYAFHAVALDERRLAFRPTLWKYPKTKEERLPSSFEQRWFPGVHSDVGGGYPEVALSDRPLEWIAQRAEACDLLVDRAVLAARPNVSERIHESQSFGYRVLGVAGRLRQVFGANRGMEISWEGELIRTVPRDLQFACVLDESIEMKKDLDSGYKPIIRFTDEDIATA